MSSTISEKKEVRLFHCITQAARAGAELQLVRLLPELSSRGYHNVVCVLRGEGELNAEFEKAADVFLKCSGTDILHLPRTILQLGRALRQQQPDITLAWMHPAAALLSCSLRIQSKLVFLIRQNYADMKHESLCSQLVCHLMMFRLHVADAICVNSLEEKLRFEAKHPHTVYIPNGFVFPACSEARPKKQTETFRIGLFARIHPMKGHVFAAQALAPLHAQGAHIELVLAGSSVSSMSTKILHDMREVAPHLPMQILGSMSSAELEEAYQSLDLLIVPSLWGEGFSNVASEAMARSIPVLMSDIGAAREIQIYEAGRFQVGDSHDFQEKVMAFYECFRKGQGTSACYPISKLGERVRDTYSLSRQGERFDSFLRELP